MVSDPVADMLTRIRNATKAGHATVAVPGAKMQREIARVLKEEGYILDFSEEPDGPGTRITITLKPKTAQGRAISGPAPDQPARTARVRPQDRDPARARWAWHRGALDLARADERSPGAARASAAKSSVTSGEGLMSRIGKLPIAVPDGVDVDLKGTHMVVKGTRGELDLDSTPQMKVAVDDGVITVTRPTDQTRHRALHGLTRSLIANMVEGVSKGFTRELELVGVGYRAEKQGNDLQLNLGFSHPVKFTTPEGITIEVPEPVKINVSGHDKELVGRVASQIRKFRPRSPTRARASCTAASASSARPASPARRVT